MLVRQYYGCRSRQLMVYPHVIPPKASALSVDAQTAQQQGGLPADVLHQPALALESRNMGVLESGSDSAPGESALDTAGAVPVPHYERIVPRIFGFPVHETSRLMAWQSRQQQKQVSRISEFRQHAAKFKASQ